MKEPAAHTSLPPPAVFAAFNTEAFSSLHVAAENCDIAYMRKYLRTYGSTGLDAPSPNKTAADNFHPQKTPLIRVIVGDAFVKTHVLQKIEAATLLLDAGVNIDTCDKNGWSPLAHAAFKREEKLVTLFICRGASLEIHAKVLDNLAKLQTADGDKIIALLATEKESRIKKQKQAAHERFYTGLPERLKIPRTITFKP